MMILIKEGSNMHKKVKKSDFEDTIGSMEKTSIYDAIVFTGVEGKSTLTTEEYRTIISKKQKLVKSDIKHQRNMKKLIAKFDWENNENY
jgi:hypothetical protein